MSPSGVAQRIRSDVRAVAQIVPGLIITQKLHRDLTKQRPPGRKRPHRNDQSRQLMSGRHPNVTDRSIAAQPPCCGGGFLAIDAFALCDGSQGNIGVRCGNRQIEKEIDRCIGEQGVDRERSSIDLVGDGGADTESLALKVSMYCADMAPVPIIPTLNGWPTGAPFSQSC